jgi:CBS-domain-containing membrane protein
VIDGILVLMLVEWLILILVRKKVPTGPRPVEILVSLGAGAALLLAMRAALLAQAWPLMALWLFVALGCHVADLQFRWLQIHN